MIRWYENDYRRNIWNIKKWNLYKIIQISDTYYEKNENDNEKSYVEIASDSIGNIRKLLSIIGKHVYIKEEGKYANLVIE